MAHCRGLRIVAALGPHDLRDLGFHELLQHRELNPTLGASKPSFAAPASSPSASRMRSGSSSMRSSAGMSGTAGTVPIAVGPPVLVGLGFAPIPVPTGPDEAGGSPSSTSTGATGRP